MKKLIFSLICIFSSTASFGKDLTVVLNEFDQYAEKAFKEWNVVGMSIAIVKDGKTIYSKGFGKRKLDSDAKVTPDTLFQIGSISKSFTTALTALAVDKKLLEWEDPVIQHLPNFLVFDPWVTRNFEIQDLYAQRSGLPGYTGDVQAMLRMPIEDVIHNLQFFPPSTSFRSQFAYQNVFFSIGAKALEAKTGKTWDDLVKNELFKPLGMTDSSSSLQDYLKEPNRAGWHLRHPDGSVTLIAEDFDMADWAYVYKASGGINSSANEMTNWIALQADQGMFQGKELISKDNLNRTHRPYVFAIEQYNGSNFYCLGWLSLSHSPYPIIWHNGGTSGAKNNLGFIPQERLGIVVLTNTTDTQLPEALTLQFFDIYYDSLNQDWSAKLLAQQKETEQALLAKTTPIKDPLPPLPLENYTGEYSNKIYGKIHITKEGNDLKVAIGPSPTIWTLKHFNKDAFSLWWYPSEGDSKVYFSFKDSNKPSHVVFEVLQEQGLFNLIEN